MPTAYDSAVETLYRGPLDTFVAERKRLAGELKAAGDKEDAARLAKLGRPSISAWAVNQLWWHERKALEHLFASAERVRKSKQGAAAEHREALADLRSLAAARLVSAGHAAPEATMRIAFVRAPAPDRRILEQGVVQERFKAMFAEGLRPGDRLVTVVQQGRIVSRVESTEITQPPTQE